MKIEGICLRKNTGRAAKFGRCLEGTDMALIARFLTDETGTTAIEYALIAAGISIVIIAAVQAIGVSVFDLFTTVKDALV